MLYALLVGLVRRKISPIVTPKFKHRIYGEVVTKTDDSVQTVEKYYAPSIARSFSLDKSKYKNH